MVRAKPRLIKDFGDSRPPGQGRGFAAPPVKAGESAYAAPKALIRKRKRGKEESLIRGVDLEYPYGAMEKEVS